MLSNEACSEIPRSIYDGGPGVLEADQDKGFERSRRDRKKIEMLFAHLKRILRLGSIAPSRSRRRAVRVHAGGDCTEPSQAGNAGRTASANRTNRVCCMKFCVAFVAFFLNSRS